MRRFATLAAAAVLGSGLAVVAGGSAAQAATRPAVQPTRATCWTTIPVVPRRLPWQPYRPQAKQCPGWHTAYVVWTLRH